MTEILFSAFCSVRDKRKRRESLSSDNYREIWSMIIRYLTSCNFPTPCAAERKSIVYFNQFSQVGKSRKIWKSGKQSLHLWTNIALCVNLIVIPVMLIIGYTRRHLHLPIEEHICAVIGKHLKDKYNERPNSLYEQFVILTKYRRKFECPIYGMILIRKKRPTLNIKKYSFPTKLFI